MTILESIKSLMMLIVALFANDAVRVWISPVVHLGVEVVRVAFVSRVLLLIHYPWSLVVRQLVVDILPEVLKIRSVLILG